MPTAVLKLLAGQGSRTDDRTDGQSSAYMLPQLGSITIREYKKKCNWALDYYGKILLPWRCFNYFLN